MSSRRAAGIGAAGKAIDLVVALLIIGGGIVLALYAARRFGPAAGEQLRQTFGSLVPQGGGQYGPATGPVAVQVAPVSSVAPAGATPVATAPAPVRIERTGPSSSIAYNVPVGGSIPGQTGTVPFSGPLASAPFLADLLSGARPVTIEEFRRYVPA